MKKTKVYLVDNEGESHLIFVFGYDKLKNRIKVLYRKSSADPSLLLNHYFTGKDGLFSAKNPQIFIQQLPEALSYCSRIWAKSA